ncbi:MAG: hypothetical protein U0326_01610 [Polyangiales bacterium]
MSTWIVARRWRCSAPCAALVAVIAAGCGDSGAPSDAGLDARADARVDVRSDVRSDVADARVDVRSDVADARVDVRDATSDIIADVAQGDIAPTTDVDDESALSDIAIDLVHPDDVPPFEEGVVTFAGAGDPGFADGLRTDARFNNPVNVVVSPDGNVYVADFNNNAVRRIEPDGWVTTLIRQANFEAPFGLAFTPDGTLYIETDANDRGGRTNTTGTIWRVAPGEHTATVVARDIGRPRGLVVLPDGRLAMTDYVLHVVETLDLTDGTVTVLAGARSRSGFVDGPGTAARFMRPYGVVLRADGNLLIADQGNQRIRLVTPEGEVSTLAGSGTAGSLDGPGAMAQFSGPQGITIDSRGLVYVSEADGHHVRTIDAEGVVATLAGNGNAGCVDGPLEEAEFYGLEGIAISPDDGILYLPDGNRGTGEPFHRMRRIQLP